MSILDKQYFMRLINQPDEQIDLFRAALCIAADSYPGLDDERYLLQMDLWVEELKQQLPHEADTRTRLHTLNRFFFDKLGFSGDTEDYYDPRNSYINEVVDRRRGIPITISLLYIELGNRLGLKVSGVSFPGHFLVKMPYGEGEVVLDPYNGGISLSEQDLTDRLEGMFNTEIDSIAPFLEAASNKDILIRMLSNLKAVYHQRGDTEKALEAIGKILALDPQRSEEYRERGVLLSSLECYHNALKDLRHYLSMHPATADSESIRELVIHLQKKHNHLH